VPRVFYFVVVSVFFFCGSYSELKTSWQKFRLATKLLLMFNIGFATRYFFSAENYETRSSIWRVFCMVSLVAWISRYSRTNAIVIGTCDQERCWIIAYSRLEMEYVIMPWLARQLPIVAWVNSIRRTLKYFGHVKHRNAILLCHVMHCTCAKHFSNAPWSKNVSDSTSDTWEVIIPLNILGCRTVNCVSLILTFFG
jgi:hypothetical protein